MSEQLRAWLTTPRSGRPCLAPLPWETGRHPAPVRIEQPVLDGFSDEFASASIPERLEALAAMADAFKIGAITHG